MIVIRDNSPPAARHASTRLITSRRIGVPAGKRSAESGSKYKSALKPAHSGLGEIPVCCGKAPAQAPTAVANKAAAIALKCGPAMCVILRIWFSLDFSRGTVPAPAMAKQPEREVVMSLMALARRAAENNSMPEIGAGALTWHAPCTLTCLGLGVFPGIFFGARLSLRFAYRGMLVIFVIAALLCLVRTFPHAPGPQPTSLGLHERSGSVVPADGVSALV